MEKYQIETLIELVQEAEVEDSVRVTALGLESGDCKDFTEASQSRDTIVEILEGLESGDFTKLDVLLAVINLQPENRARRITLSLAGNDYEFGEVAWNHGNEGAALLANQSALTKAHGLEKGNTLNMLVALVSAIEDVES